MHEQHYRKKPWTSMLWALKRTRLSGARILGRNQILQGN
jgi:hypothetical protein